MLVSGTPEGIQPKADVSVTGSFRRTDWAVTNHAGLSAQEGTWQLSWVNAGLLCLSSSCLSPGSICLSEDLFSQGLLLCAWQLFESPAGKGVGEGCLQGCLLNAGDPKLQRV